VLFLPADAKDLAAFLKDLPDDIPVTVIGVGSNLIVRDGGVRGVVIRLAGRAFGDIAVLPGDTIRAGAAALDMQVALAAARAGLAGLEFLRGIPGSIGGAVRMNAGAYGGEVKDALVSAEAVSRTGDLVRLSTQELGFAYRSCAAPQDLIFLAAEFHARPGERAVIEARMADIMARREASQPIRERTGGSTFKNPDPEISGGRKSWELIDAAGFRGRSLGGAQFSPLHCNFLINTGAASASELEALGEDAIAAVKQQTGITLQWEIKRIGERA
jgi:UDP-N-acetylmuramate dehydrogenase